MDRESWIRQYCVERVADFKDLWESNPHMEDGNTFRQSIAKRVLEDCSELETKWNIKLTGEFAREIQRIAEAADCELCESWRAVNPNRIKSALDRLRTTADNPHFESKTDFSGPFLMHAAAVRLFMDLREGNLESPFFERMLGNLLTKPLAAKDKSSPRSATRVIAEERPWHTGSMTIAEERALAKDSLFDHWIKVDCYIRDRDRQKSIDTAKWLKQFRSRRRI